MPAASEAQAAIREEMSFLLVVTLVSMLLAVVMTVVAWRTAREERRRSEARVAVLAADIQTAVAASAVGKRTEPRLRAVTQTPTSSGDLFAAGPSSASSRSVIVIGVGLAVFATAAALIVVLSSGARSSTAASPASPVLQGQPIPTPGARPTSSIPLELVALGHQRDGDRLIVRGVIRNPSNGGRTDRLTAVVFLFDRNGGFVTSGRASIDPAALPPGGESTFLVTVPGAADVSRYRVSFRSDSGIVPHVDKRTRS
jgi:flagellar basal body-associated protein FliL